MRKSDQKRDFKPIKRTTQIIFGERQHLRSVLESLDKFPRKREEKVEHAKLRSLIQSRTDELNAITPDWDRKISQARDPKATADKLARLAAYVSADDYLLLRTISENPNTPASVLALLAQHSYDAGKENVARHPNADGPTLQKLAGDPSRPLWFLVACNSATPKELRDRLRKRMQMTASAAS